MSTQFQNANKIKFMPLPYIGMFDLDVIYQTSDAELLYQVLYKLNELAKSQNIIIDNFQKVIEWATEQIENFTKEQLEEWLNNGTLTNIILSLGNVVKYIDTTAQAINDTTLISGMYIATKGYDQIGDRGGCVAVITATKIADIDIPCSAGYLHIINDVINVRQYGNIDKLINFQSLLTYAQNNGLELYLPYGDYVVTEDNGDIALYNGICSIKGDGISSRILCPIGTQKSLFYISNISLDHIHIKNIFIGANNEDYLGDYNTINHVFYFNMLETDYIRELTVNNVKISKIKGYFIYQLASNNINFGLLNIEVKNCSFYSQVMYADKCNMMLFENNIVYRTTTNEDGRYAFNLNNNTASYGINFINNDSNLPSVFNNIYGLQFTNEYYEVPALNNPTSGCVILFNNCRFNCNSSNFTTRVYDNVVRLTGNNIGSFYNSQLYSSIEIDNVLYADHDTMIVPLIFENSNAGTPTSSLKTNAYIVGYTYHRNFTDSNNNQIDIYCTINSRYSYYVNFYAKVPTIFKSFNLPVLSYISSIPVFSNNLLNYSAGHYSFTNSFNADVAFSYLFTGGMTYGLFNDQNYTLVMGG